MADNIPYVEKLIEVGDLEIGLRAEPFRFLQGGLSENGENKMVSRMILSLKANQKQVVAKFLEIFYRINVKIYDKNGNEISDMPKRSYFPSDHFKEEILPPNKMRRLALLAYAKGNTNSFDFLNVKVSFTNNFNSWTHPFSLRVSVPVNH